MTVAPSGPRRWPSCASSGWRRRYCLAPRSTRSSGFLLQDLREAEFSRAILDRADEVCIAADASKFGGKAPIQIAEPGRFARLFSDSTPPADIATLLEVSGVSLCLAV